MKVKEDQLGRKERKREKREEEEVEIEEEREEGGSRSRFARTLCACVRALSALMGRASHREQEIISTRSIDITEGSLNSKKKKMKKMKKRGGREWRGIAKRTEGTAQNTREFGE